MQRCSRAGMIQCQTGRHYRLVGHKLACHRRGYHSLEHDNPPPFTQIEIAILLAGLRRVPGYGFTKEALSLGAQDAGYLSISTNLFPAGPFALVHYHLVSQRLDLKEKFQRPDISPLTNEPPKNILDNIYNIMDHRLRSNDSVIHQYQQALALLSLPSNLPTGLKELARLADEILYLAGSTSVTSAWYTDRAALSSIYAAAEMYMTQDRSERYNDTSKFLLRLLHQGHDMRNRLSMAAQWAGMQTGGLVDGLRSKGVWI